MSGEQMCQMIQKHMPADSGMTVSGCKIACTNPAATGGDKPVTESPGVDSEGKDADGLLWYKEGTIQYVSNS